MIFFTSVSYAACASFRFCSWTGVPKSITGVFQGLLLFSLLASDTLIHYRIKLTKKSVRPEVSKGPQAKGAAA